RPDQRGRLTCKTNDEIRRTAALPVEDRQARTAGDGDVKNGVSTADGLIIALLMAPSGGMSNGCIVISSPWAQMNGESVSVCQRLEVTHCHR
ncbi:hypothetical protein NHX12_028360, partial [Muraenolepis orangiensis]